jgi:hypothetical protein
MTERLRDTLVYGTSSEAYKDLIKQMSYRHLISHTMLMQKNGYVSGSAYDEETRDQLCCEQAECILQEKIQVPVGISSELTIAPIA